ncbi:MAG: glycosyltransferase family 2 protein [Nitrospirae bacterium]|nr:glycosyltransferase family 2 protein [Nitrospirota bacterium]
MISIIIPTYNSSKFIPDLLGSIFKQAVDDIEVIMVDDRSTDNTVELVKQYPVRLIEMERNGGPAKARNKGVREAKGDIIFFLDSDVIVLEGTIKAVKEYFQRNPSAKCVIGICDTMSLNKGFVPHYMAMFEYIHLIGTPVKEKKLDNAGPTEPSNGIAALSAFVSYVLMFLLPCAPVLKNAIIFLLIIFFFANLKWWNFMRKEAGLFFAVKALFLNYFLGIVSIFAAMYGVISYPFAKKEII